MPVAGSRQAGGGAGEGWGGAPEEAPQDTQTQDTQTTESRRIHPLSPTNHRAVPQASMSSFHLSPWYVPCYSARSAAIGSIFIARRTGSSTAGKATPKRSKAACKYAPASTEAIPKSWLSKNREAANAPPNPSTTPVPASTAPAAA